MVVLLELLFAAGIAYTLFCLYIIIMGSIGIICADISQALRRLLRVAISACKDWRAEHKRRRQRGLQGVPRNSIGKPPTS
jgi:hypothetical protein